jgi:hypothetical protein
MKADKKEEEAAKLEKANAEKAEEAKAKAKKEKKGKAEKPKAEAVELPILVEIGFTFSGILLLATVLIVAGISFVSGASLLDIFLRTLVSIAGMGGLLFLFNWQFSTGTIQGAMIAYDEEVQEMLRKEREALGHIDESMLGMDSEPGMATEA